MIESGSHEARNLIRPNILLKLGRCRHFLAAAHRGFAFYVGNPFPPFLVSWVPD
jgi:hypothetical protein